MLFLAIRKRLDQDDQGFTLIELLVVVIIIGILAAIAIPAFLNQRERARVANVQSDLRNAAIEAETYFTEEGTYVGLTAADVNTNESTDVTLGVGADNADNYCLTAEHDIDTDIDWVFDSDADPQLREDTDCTP